MAKLSEPLVGVGHTGEVPNRKVAKSQFLLVLVLVLVLLVDKSLRSHNSVIIVGFTLKLTPMKKTG